MNYKKILRTVLMLSTSFCFFSCATIMNDRTTHIAIRTEEPTKIVYQQDTLKTFKNTLYLVVPRRRDPVYITAITDSITKSDIRINSRLSSAFYGNFVIFGIFGMAVDFTNPKRFGYPKEVFIRSNDTANKYYRWIPVERKKHFDLVISLPHLNSFVLDPEGYTLRDHVGFLGFSVGGDYYYKENKFVNFTVGAVTDFLVPVPLPVDHGDNYETMSALYASVSDNYRFNRMSLGYGFSVSRNTWAIREGMFPSELRQPTPVSKSNTAAGLVLSSYFQTGKRFHIGLVYRPTFIRFNAPETFLYEHVLSLDLAWKFSI